MISAENLNYLEAENAIPYILGARMRKDKEVREQVLTCGGRYQEVHPHWIQNQGSLAAEGKGGAAHGPALHRLSQ